MALEIQYEDAAGVVHPQAYLRIDKIIIENPGNGSKNVSLDVSVYSSQEARDAGKSRVWGPQGYLVQRLAAEQPEAKDGEPAPQPVMECAVDPDTVTASDCYTWLKDQEKFIGAKDILEPVQGVERVRI